jgi:hypothetical protein
MALPVLAEYKRLTEFINKENTFFARLQWSENLIVNPSAVVINVVR